MKTIDEQLAEILRRSDGVKEKRALRRKITRDLVSLSFCAVLLLVTGLLIPRVEMTSSFGTAGSYGSLILGTADTGYVVIGVCAFLTGICVTILSQHYRKWKELNRKEEDGRS